MRNFLKNHRAFSIALSTNTEPKHYEEAMSQPCWKKVIKSELDSLDESKTWKITSLPPRKKPIGCKWVFKVKYNLDGSVERHKARLVAKGYTQVPSIDYRDTFSPVLKLTSLRMVLGLAAAKNWYLKQIDVNTVFLHGDLDEEVYMVAPPGLNIGKGQVCKLEKLLYGLKQAIYVDDLVLAGDAILEINKIKSVLDDLFKIKDIGDLKFFLRLEVARSDKGIALYQRKYVVDMLTNYGFADCKPISTPMDYSVKLSKDSGNPLSDSAEYRKIVGKLLYLTNTPDISYAVSRLSQYLDKPTSLHLHAAHRVLRYLKSTPAQGLFFPTSTDLCITGFSDSDWTACPDTRRSTSAYCFFLESALISWKSKKQNTVSCSFFEAE
ncbi:uncharacterized protein LOC107632833 [Arachis ipaensis]|uniref:uncharacterized protein LOC107632833 n=1 Tax=Arachis ipaensis TaxID=130454 RepID=UPI0007AF0E4A|nr:uncharacterized protein LOC107632833 [Arachis ipaensis]